MKTEPPPNKQAKLHKGINQQTKMLNLQLQDPKGGLLKNSTFKHKTNPQEFQNVNKSGSKHLGQSRQIHGDVNNTGGYRVVEVQKQSSILNSAGASHNFKLPGVGNNYARSHGKGVETKEYSSNQKSDYINHFMHLTSTPSKLKPELKIREVGD